MILLVDAGNTRIKWAFHVGETLLPGGSWSTREVAALPAFALDAGLADSADRVGPEPASRAVVACVAGEAVRGALADAFEGRGIQPHWLTPALSAHGLVNRYQPPQSLGVDRYAALVGALHRVGRSCVVVSVGTALTADMLTAEGEFLGGCIVPGPELMRTALASGTAGVGKAEGGWQDWPRTTGSAVDTGIALALAGVVRGMRERLAGGPGRALPPVVLTGGARAGMVPLLSGEVVEIDELVLEGLSWIARGLEFGDG